MSTSIIDNLFVQPGVEYNGLPIVVMDDDFIEYLVEEGYYNSIELDDLYVQYEYWARENTETRKK